MSLRQLTIRLGTLGWPAILLAAVPFLLPWGSTASDVLLYGHYAERMAAGELPYVDIPIEYPPLAVALFYAPRLGVSGGAAYVACFLLAMGGVELAWKGLLWRRLATALQRGSFLLICTLAGAALYYTYLKRYDMVAAAATAVVCDLAVRKPRGLGAWVWGGLAVCCKLYPIVAVPVLLLHGRRQGVPWMRQGLQLAVAAVTVGAVFGAAYGFWGPASFNWWTYHHDRGLHLGSTYTAVALAWQGFGHGLPTEVAFGSWQVATDWAHACALASPWVTAAALGITWIWVGRRCHTPGDLWGGVSAAVIALLLCSKVFSPQYMIWLVPGVAMASVLSGPRGESVDGWLAAGLVLACAFTAVTYPNEYRIASGQVSKQVCLLLRDGVLLALWLRLCHGPQMLVFRRGNVNLVPTEGVG